MGTIITFPPSRTRALGAELGRVYRASRVLVILHAANGRYHRPACYHYDPRQPAMTMREARRRGGTPCGICCPVNR